jgi:hypothetical protein
MNTYAVTFKRGDNELWGWADKQFNDIDGLAYERAVDFAKRILNGPLSYKFGFPTEAKVFNLYQNKSEWAACHWRDA